MWQNGKKKNLQQIKVKGMQLSNVTIFKKEAGWKAVF